MRQTATTTEGSATRTHRKRGRDSDEYLPEHPTGGEEHGINGSEVVVLSVESHHHAEKGEIGEAKKTKLLHGTMK